MTVLTTYSSAGGGQLMPSVDRLCLHSFFTALHTGLPEEGFWCSFLSLLLQVFASLAANRCCLDSEITGAGVSSESLNSTPRGVVGSSPRIDLACRLRRSRRSSRLPASLGTHHSSLPYSATAWTHATGTAQTLSGTTPYILVRVRSLASTALALFMHQLWCSSSVRCASIQTPNQRVARLLNGMKQSPTLIFPVSFGRRCVLWPRLRVNSAASIFAVSNCSPRRLAHTMLFAVHLSCIVMTWLRSHPVASQPISSTKGNPSGDAYSSTLLISPEVLIAKRMVIQASPASTGCLSMALPSITISTVRSERKLSVHHM